MSEEKKGVFWALDLQTGKKFWVTEKMLREAESIMSGGIKIGIKLRVEND